MRLFGEIVSRPSRPRRGRCLRELASQFRELQGKLEALRRRLRSRRAELVKLIELRTFLQRLATNRQDHARILALPRGWREPYGIVSGLGPDAESSAFDYELTDFTVS